MAKKDKDYKYLYGPVYSWRLGVSLGIDPLSQESKICNFDCIYCQLGNTKEIEGQRKIYVPTKNLIKEIKTLPDLQSDYLTFSGRGEPTLAKNLGEMIREIRKIREEKIAVITNSSLMYQKEVQDDLLLADFVLAKLDICSEETLKTIHRVTQGPSFRLIIDGIKGFRMLFKGKLALQIMFVKQNKDYAGELAKIAKNIKPDEVELNTPLRLSSVKPLSKGELKSLRNYFNAFPVVTVYDTPKEAIEPFDEKETVKRHGRYKNSKEVMK